MKYFPKYLLVGLSNSILGYAVIFFLMYCGHLSSALSNIIGYMVGLGWSFLLNRKYVFRTHQAARTEFYRFILIFCIAYAANFLALIFLEQWGELNRGLNQIIAGCTYVAISYFLNKHYVFRPRVVSNN